MSVDRKQKEILEELEALPDWRDRYDFVIDLGRELDPLPEEMKTDENLIPGCVSRLWLTAAKKDGKVIFQADGDSLFVKGLAAVMLKIFSDETPEDILAERPNFLMESGIIRNLSPNRVNGAVNFYKKIIDSAAHFAVK